MADRFFTLMNRLRRVEDIQAKNINLKDCRVFGGELPQDIKDKIRSPQGQAKIQAKIDKAERLKLTLAVAIYEAI